MLPLTEEQRDLAGSNLGLAFAFAFDKKLPGEDFDRILSAATYGLTLAAKYHKPHQYFPATAYRWMTRKFWESYAEAGPVQIKLHDMRRDSKGQKRSIMTDKATRFALLEVDKTHDPRCHRDNRIDIHAAVDKLTPRQRQIVIMWMQGCGDTEIGRILGRTENSIYKTRMRAFESLRVALKDYND